MSDIWNFHPLLEQQIHQFITSAPQPDENNKWFKKFGHKAISLTCNENLEILSKKRPNQECVKKIPEPTHSPENKRRKIISDKQQNFDEFLEIVENSPILQFNYLIEECLNDNSLFIKLAEQLSTNCVEKICKHVYENKNTNSVFIHNFHKFFIPTFLKRDYSCISLDILVRAHANYPTAFKPLLHTIIKDLDISNKILQEFINSIDEIKQTQLILDISDIELTAEEFVNNIFSIYTAYKNSEKNSQIQNYILNNLLLCGHSCSNDKQYGRLLLAFLQAEKQLNMCHNYGNIEKIIEINRTPFKRPCQNAFKELNGNS
ncbi:uncharacterized protein LOC131842792 [Achroia grisella]|uniref:uncharacterized protein LOC131842792 n=1 Tax=Achroia grisella TaxID=688607 RepID=UPI0027D35016|nr:uncharacterized protein LOC131842792 [Achroia grisella]